MSASRDKSQKIAFVYSNLYQLYRDERESQARTNPPAAPAPSSAGTARVLKTGDLNSGTFATVRVKAFSPAELIGKRIQKPEPQPARAVQNQALNSLKDNLRTLNQLHERLRFMLQELEDLVKE